MWKRKRYVCVCVCVAVCVAVYVGRCKDSRSTTTQHLTLVIFPLLVYRQQHTHTHTHARTHTHTHPHTHPHTLIHRSIYKHTKSNTHTQTRSVSVPVSSRTPSLTSHLHRAQRRFWKTNAGPGSSYGVGHRHREWRLEIGGEERKLRGTD